MGKAVTAAKAAKRYRTAADGLSVMSGIGHLQPSPSGCFGKWPTLASEGAVLEKPDLIVVVQGDEITARSLSERRAMTSRVPR
jgi:hypothetical protein